VKSDPASDPLAGVGIWKRCLILFWAYVKITSLVIGGGYAIIAAASNEFVRRRHWLTEDDIIEMITITQTVPGVIACNSAIYIGWRLGGILGAVAALIGAILPSVIIITCIAAIISTVAGFVGNPYVQGAFHGMIACIVGMVVVTALKMRKKAVHGVFGWLIAAGCLVGMCIVKTNPAWLIVGAVVLGLIKIASERWWKKAEESK